MYRGWMDQKVAVIGAGSWGTTLASLASVSVPTVLWARRKDVAREISGRHTNSCYLPGYALSPSLEATSSVGAALDEATLVVMATPSHGFRKVLEQASDQIASGIPILSLAKGIEQGTNMRMSELVAAVVPSSPAGVLTGPNLAREVLEGQPSASVVAFADEALARVVQEILGGLTLRVYTSSDVVGCEIAGAGKNVMAIAAGISDGLGFGDNTRATLITRGLAELRRLGVSMGAQPATFAGLAGVGDIVATCTSGKSRNHTVGVRLARGEPVDAIVAAMDMVAEGIKTADPLLGLAASHDVELPIAGQVQAVLSGSSTPAASIKALMGRRAVSELEGMPR